MKRNSSSTASKSSNAKHMKKKKSSNSSRRSSKKSNNIPRHQGSYNKSSKKSLKKKKQRQQQQPRPLPQQQQQVFIKRSSGRKEKFDANRMAQTVSRSGVPFLMARDVAKKVSTKIINETTNDDARKQIKKRKQDTASRSKGAVVPPQPKLKRERERQQKEKTVTAGRIRNLVANELRDRNRSDIAASYTGQMPENTLQEQNLKDKQPIEDTVAANKNRVLHDTSKRGGGIMT
jgi:hypothetical protein